jgi:hypothetical protein
MEVVVLNCWVTDTKLTPCLSNCSTILAKLFAEIRRRVFAEVLDPNGE